ncbi:MAG: hypothetical protein ACJAVR_001620 [Paracoccaceae bacterium]|jgi:hypothetical protein
MPDMPMAAPDHAPLVSDADAAAAAERLRERIGADAVGALDPEMHALGVALATHRMERGAPGFYAVALSIAAELRAEPGRLHRLLRPWYEGARDLLEDHDRIPAGVDGPDAVRAALRAIKGAPEAPAPTPMSAPKPTPASQAPAPPPPNDAPNAAPAWDAALSRAEQAAARPVSIVSAPSGGYEPRASVIGADLGAPRTRRSKRKTGGYRFSDLVWGAFFVPAVLIGLVAFYYFLALPPMNYLTGIATWDVRVYTFYPLLGAALWLTSVALLFPPIWYAWWRGRRGWVWPMLAAVPVTAILVFISTLIVLRSPMHADFLSQALQWTWKWGPVTFAAAASIAFGSRLRGGSRRIFRRIGRWWDRRRRSGTKAPR